MKTFKQFLKESKVASETFTLGSTGKCIVYDNGDVIYYKNGKQLSKEHLKDMSVDEYKDRLIKKNGWKKVSDMVVENQLKEALDKDDIKQFEYDMEKARGDFDTGISRIEDILRFVVEESEYNVDNHKKFVYKHLDNIEKNFNLLEKSVKNLLKAAQGK